MSVDEGHTTVPNLNLSYFILTRTDRPMPTSVKEPNALRQPRHLSLSEFNGLNGQFDSKTRIAHLEDNEWEVLSVVYHAKVLGAHHSRIYDFKDYVARGKPESVPAF